MSLEKSSGINDIEELRQLLLGSDLKKIQEIYDRLDCAEKFSTEVGKALPHAVIKSAKNGKQLTEAMVPVIMPAIRKSITNTIKQMVQSFNQVLQHALSWKGIKWRIESLRTGIPFEQVVFLNSFEFRVEQVFLIHHETGMLLAHLEQDNTLNQDADLVSSMLSAIRDFVGDSFDVDNIVGLDSIHVGDFSILIEQSSGLILATSSRGNVPISLRTTMEETLKKIQLKFSDNIMNFKGDTRVFDDSKELMLFCLVKSNPVKANKKILLRTKLIALIVFALFLYWIVLEIYSFNQQQNYVELLEKQDGYVVTNVIRDGNLLIIKGLKDPLAVDARKLLASSSLNVEDIKFQFKPYLSFDEKIVEQRLLKKLQLPKNITIDYNNGKLKLFGYAREDLINLIDMMGGLIVGVDSVDTSRLKRKVDLSSLKPVDSVNLKLDINSGHLVSSGVATKSWAKFAKEQAIKISGVRSYDDSLLDTRNDFSAFNSPKGVSMTLKGRVLVVSGKASDLWIKSLKLKASNLDDFDEIDLKALVNTDLIELEAYIQKLRNKRIFFEAGEASYEKSNKQGVKDLAEVIEKIIKKSNSLSKNPKILIKGKSDSAGSYKYNTYLSLKRAKSVAKRLLKSGINRKYIETKGLNRPVKTEISIVHKKNNRSVTFEVVFIKKSEMIRHD